MSDELRPLVSPCWLVAWSRSSRSLSVAALPSWRYGALRPTLSSEGTLRPLGSVAGWSGAGPERFKVPTLANWLLVRAVPAWQVLQLAAANRLAPCACEAVSG